jgi:hypothetical protein
MASPENHTIPIVSRPSTIAALQRSSQELYAGFLIKRLYLSSYILDYENDTDEIGPWLECIVNWIK